ncbi:hypothetical protein [Spirochaeta isovalerica]|uniref:Uncharacterized protein n=1 Tax=Spirochaeta isovalerica TaxID=150 RepID=A0A841RCF0_9SPIO|nr:hypothetical protein [Spirochaeta isovalerica]MBB6481665.1 hypothetical protein [Spirochaeta isovalerica]
MKLYRKALPILLFAGVLFSLSAEGIEHTTSIGAEFAYYFDNNQGWGQDGGFLPLSYSPVSAPVGFSYAADDYGATLTQDEKRTLGSGWGSVELQTYLKHRIKLPFLQGDNALIADNNATVNLDLYVAPVALYGRASVTITPIAFLNFNIGGLIGTGWNAAIFNGVGDNVNGQIMTDSFPGAVTELFSSATFQFDLAALVPGEWNHVVTQINGKFKYSWFSSDHAQDDGTGNPGPWQWLADDGENLNGWEYEGTYFLGYQMPLVIDTVGFLVETSQFLGSNSLLSPMAGPDGDVSTTADNGWGSDFIAVTFGPLMNFSFNDHHSLAVLVQFKTGRDYTDDTIFNEYYQNRAYEATYTKFHRIALAYNYKF